jgi:hypothetical protein
MTRIVAGVGYGVMTWLLNVVLHPLTWALRDAIR